MKLRSYYKSNAGFGIADLGRNLVWAIFLVGVFMLIKWSILLHDKFVDWREQTNQQISQ